MNLLILIAAALFSTLEAAPLDISSQPTIGDTSAKVQVVALLEPKCPDSKQYNNEIFPKLKTEFIDTKKISYTVITTSFLKDSMPAAIALLCVYDQNSSSPHTDLFFDYLNYIYKVQPAESENWATADALLKYAGEASSNINQGKLKSCLESKHYRYQVIHNTAYGNKLMGHIHTPTLFVNGVKIANKDDTVDYEKLKVAIQEALIPKVVPNLALPARQNPGDQRS